jgi:GTP-binding protein
VSKETVLSSRWLFAQPCEFIAGVATLGGWPPTPPLPEFAFVGRSNVGKSSLLNALTHRKQLAKVSHTPGRTRQINLFNLAGRLLLADLPGYGYAKVSKSERILWDRLVQEYLATRHYLHRVYVLIDSKVGMKDSDRHMFSLLDHAGIAYHIVWTKLDKASAEARASLSAQYEAVVPSHPALLPTMFSVSSRTKAGIDVLQQHILDELMAFASQQS